MARARPAWKSVPAGFGLILIVIVAATSVRLAVAVHTVSPGTEISDIVSLVHPPEPDSGSLAGQINSNHRINILLLAHGGAGNDNPNFTDTVIVVSIRPHSHQASVISLPRYLWVEIPAPVVGEIQGKLYEAYALATSQNDQFLRPQWRTGTGPGDLAAATVAETIGQPIDYWISIDATAFGAVIDALGGVRVLVPDVLDDWNFPVGDAGQTIHIHFDPGPQLLDGRRALEYARSRLSTSETDRSRRQELVVVSLLKNLRMAHPGVGLLGAFSAVEDGLRTNLRPLEIQELSQLVSQVHEEDVKRITLDDSGLLESQAIGTGEILVPIDGTFAAVRTLIAQALP
jgi:LCP family protein required for cell wall assembly